MKRKILAYILSVLTLFNIMGNIVFAQTAENDLVLWYKLNETSGTVVKDSSGNSKDGTLLGGGIWLDGKGVELDGVNDHIQMPNGILTGLTDTTVMINAFVDNANINPSWLFTFGSALDPVAATGTKYFGLVSENTRYRPVLTANRWSAEQSIVVSRPIMKGAWKSYVVTLKGDVGTIYEDGVSITTSGMITLNPQDIEATIANYIGKPAYPGDRHLKGKIKDFRIYNRALDGQEIEQVLTETDSESLDLGDISSVIQNIDLPTKGYNGSVITWSSNKPDIITNGGVVKRPTDQDTLVKLTAQLNLGSAILSKAIDVTVKAQFSDEDSVNFDKESLDLGNLSTVTSDITLPTSGTNDTTITWHSDKPDIITALGVVKRPAADEENAVVTLTATIAKNGESRDKIFTATVIARSQNPTDVWYAFDETSGNTAADYLYNKGNANLIGGARWEPGALNGGVKLDGTAAAVQLPNNLLDDMNSVTIASWVRLDARRGWQRIWDLGTDSNSNMFLTTGGWLGSVEKGLGIHFKVGTVEDTIYSSTLYNLPIDEWKHIAFTLTGTTGIIYVGGEEVARNNNMKLTPNQLISSNGNNYIGKSKYAADPYFNGAVDEFRIFGSALSVEDIKKDLIEPAKVKDNAVEPITLLEVIDTNSAVTTLVGEEPQLPSKVQVKYSNGMEDGVAVAWDSIDPINYQSEGSFEVKGTIKENPYAVFKITDRADPWVYKHTDGYYYFTASYTDPQNNNIGMYQYTKIILRKAKTINGLATAEEKVIYTKAPLQGNRSPHIWAPEIHYINGKWYIYYTVSISTTDQWAIRPHVLECADADPTTGTWVEKGQVQKASAGDLAFNGFSLDHTTFEHNGKRYMIWAQNNPNSNLYIAQMSNPWTLSSHSVLMAQPEYNWETRGYKVNEGAAVIKRNGKIFVAYSASATDANYCLGLLTASDTSDLLDSASWSKTKQPVMTSSRANNIFGPGHNSFTVSEDGTEDIVIYHGRPEEKYVSGSYEPLYDSGRHAYAQKLFWNADGTPGFGVPKGNDPGQTISVKATVTVKADTTTDSSIGLIAHYDMSRANGKLVDVTNSGFDAPYVGFVDGDFIKEGTDVLNFTGNKAKYVKLPNGIIDDETFTISTKFNTSTAANHWLYALGTKTGEWPNVNNYIFLNPRQGNGTMRFGIKNASTELLFQNASINSGVYNTITSTFEVGKISIYLNGTLVGSVSHSYSVKDILAAGVSNPTDCIGFIGRSLYTPDPAFTGKLAEFKVYNYTLSAAEIQAKSIEEDGVTLAQDFDILSLGDTSQIETNLVLPSKGLFGSNITWTSSNETYLTNAGRVTRPRLVEGNQTLQLTALLKKGSLEKTKVFQVTVIAEYSDQQRVDIAADQVAISNTNDIRGNITLPEATKDGLPITWTAVPAGVISTETIPADQNNNYAPIPAGVVTRQGTDTVVKLTATVTLNDKTASKDIDVSIKAAPVPLAEEDYKGYVFAHFKGEGPIGEQVYFASSTDGLRWTDLNDVAPVLTSSVGDKGVRDPYILRSPEGDKFYMIATDLRIANGAGWGAAQNAGSKSIVVWESTDLVNWSKERLVKVARDDAGCTWAPEIVYDDKTGEYLVFWASKIAADNFAKQRMYIAKTRDFYTFTEPELYVERANHVIDSTIIKHKGIYYRYSKDETNSTINIDTSDQMLGKAFIPLPSPSVDAQKGVEGPAIFKFIGEDKWCLLVDQYGGIGYYPLVTDDITTGVFTRLDSSEYNIPTRFRHGTVMTVTHTEYEALQDKWGPLAPIQEEEKQEPILEYNFDETLNTDQTVVDVSGNNKSGTLLGNATYKQDTEKNSQVLYLDGTANTHMAFPDGFFDGRNTMTISMDIRSEMASGNFFTFTFGKDNNRYMFLKTLPTTIRNAMTISTYTGEKAVSATTETIQNKWVNIKIVLTAGTMALYKDGVLLSENKATGLSVSDLGSALKGYLGKSFYSPDGYFKGSFDNVKVYNRALSEIEIANEFGVKIQEVKNVTAEGYTFIHKKIDKHNKKITLYVKRGKDLSAVPLVFELVEGAAIAPAQKTVVNLTAPVTYTVTSTQNPTGEEWTVETIIANNPVLDGLYADPDIDVFGDTFYIYPTTDGFTSWSGTKFHVFSSKNMLDWKDEGVILDVATDDVPWAVGSAWAPSIEEKNGKYYFYFCAKLPNGQSSMGVAVSDTPIGPFIAEATPMITPAIASTQGITMGQTIDPSIFTDDDGRSYMYFGNGNAAVVELNEDMISFKPGTMKNISGVSDFREAITVTKRNGIYHFTWSGDDTGSENYRVNYGTSNNLYGPVSFRQTILSKDVSNDILGTGHHSIVQIPGKDEYYIAYHRFGTPLANYPTGKGYNRETCIAKVEFDENGYMKVITPTLIGLTEPVIIEEQPPQETPVTGVTLDKLAASVTVGQNMQLTATVLPAHATHKAVTWSTSDAEVATVDEEGKVTGVKAGTATITVTTADGSLKATCVVTVEDDPTIPEVIITRFIEKHVTTTIGTAPILPEEIDAQYSDGSIKKVSVTWNEVTADQYSEAGVFVVEGIVEGTELIARVSVSIPNSGGGGGSSGSTIKEIRETQVTTIVGIAPALPTEVDVLYRDGVTKKVSVTWDEVTTDLYAEPGHFIVEGILEGTELKAKVTVTVEAVQVPTTPVTSVTLDKLAASVTAGQNIQLTATVLPAYATNKALTWSTSDGAVATVDEEGKVTAVNAGTATITVTTADGGKTAACVVTVTTSNSGGSSGGGGSSTVIPPVVTPPVVTPPVVPTETTQNNEVVKVSLSLISGTASEDGVNIELTVKPYIEQGRTMAGIRDIANILQIENKNIVWNNNTKEITIKTNSKEIKLRLNQKYAMVDGKKVDLDVPPQIKEGRTVLPVASIARLLGASVQFNEKTKEVIIIITK